MSIASDGDSPMSARTLLEEMEERVSLLESGLKASTDSVAAIRSELKASTVSFEEIEVNM